jgi:hypothetical protein
VADEAPDGAPGLGEGAWPAHAVDRSGTARHVEHQDWTKACVRQAWPENLRAARGRENQPRAEIPRDRRDLQQDLHGFQCDFRLLLPDTKSHFLQEFEHCFD